MPADGKRERTADGEVTDALTYEVIGAAQKVHRALGPGFRESTYHKALGRELILRRIPFESEREFEVFYEGTFCDTYRPDIVVDGTVIVELKAATGTTAVDRLQTLSYLRASGLHKALLLNFGAASPEVRRFTC